MLQTLLTRLIQGYRMFLSPLLPPTCRFTPTCSQYALDAIRRYGVWKGGWLAIRRILRCHPFHAGATTPCQRCFGRWTRCP